MLLQALVAVMAIVVAVLNALMMTAVWAQLFWWGMVAMLVFGVYYHRLRSPLSRGWLVVLLLAFVVSAALKFV